MTALRGLEYVPLIEVKLILVRAINKIMEFFKDLIGVHTETQTHYAKEF